MKHLFQFYCFGDVPIGETFYVPSNEDMKEYVKVSINSAQHGEEIINFSNEKVWMEFE